MIRSGNESDSKDVIIYIGISYLGSSDTWKLGRPVANIRPKSADETLNKIMNSLTGIFKSPVFFVRK